MTAGMTLFQLAVDSQEVFDGSVKGVGIAQTRNVVFLPASQSVKLQNGAIQVRRHPSLDQLQSFTVEVTIHPTQVGGTRKTVLEAESPAIALYIGPNQKLMGAVHTAAGWQTVDSGATLVQPKKDSAVRFSRAENGVLTLQVGRAAATSGMSSGPLVATGERGITIGAAADGQSAFFVGRLSNLKIMAGVVIPQFYQQKRRQAQRIKQALIAGGFTKVTVNLLPDASHQRLQPIKDIMNAAGVERLSDLSTLRITVPTPIPPGRVLIAARKSAAPVDWGALAETFKQANAGKRRALLARHLTNRNSAKVLRTMGAEAQLPAAAFADGHGAVSARISAAGESARGGPRLPPEVLRASPTLRLSQVGCQVADLIRRDPGGKWVVDKAVLQDLEADTPLNWPTTSGPAICLSLNTIPVSISVIIAGTLDLTDTRLIIEPTVSTLYIIAEKVICGPNAAITWRKPGGSAPDTADNPDLDGRGYSGVQPKPDSRDGLDGEDGQSGEAGVRGSDGCLAPSLEMWVKEMAGLPTVDLTGEDGITGGRGQRGGRGGNGADGQAGERLWFGVWHCITDPGDGGDGGNGGQGGDGGQGGKGGDGGRISIGVLEGTLANTVRNRPLSLNKPAGRAGQGGPGGAGGYGGAGGRSGAGETCHEAEDGHSGAQAQPGGVGPVGERPGTEKDLEFFEFTQDAWDDLLTRPWLNDVTPPYAFPGDVLTLRGSRFSSNDRVIIDGLNLTPTLNADESISVTLPLYVSGGRQTVYVRRQDGTESNRDVIWVKPQLDDPGPLELVRGADITLYGRAFVSGASVVINGSAISATVLSAAQLSFTMPGTGGRGATEATVSVEVRNPDGMVSNARSGHVANILEIPFKFGQHNLSFSNFDDGVPDWGTFSDTFGAVEVWFELLDDEFGHPVLTAAFFGFYEHFLMGAANGGLATGFCTSLASLVADRFWQGYIDGPAQTKAAWHKWLTAIHGRLLSRQSLIHFHDQSRDGVGRVLQTYRDIEGAFLRGCDRYNMPLIFFIPSGAIWDAGYINQLGGTHTVMPLRFVYPAGRTPELSADGSTTLTDPDGVQLFVWDCNGPENQNCRFVFRSSNGQIDYDYFNGGDTAQFSSTNGITLGMMTLGDYLLSNHDMPFSGPLGLTSFIVDFLLSPAELEVTDANGLRTGNFSGQILSEIPDSHPCYLIKGAYLLPTATPLTRRIVGTAGGQYNYHSIMPDGTSLMLENVPTAAGQQDVLAINSDASQIRLTPGVDKGFNLTLTRMVGNQARALAIEGLGAGPTAALDITVSPELSLLRVGNRAAARTVEVRAFAIDRTANTPVNKKLTNISLPTDHDLAIAVADWAALDVTAEAVPF